MARMVAHDKARRAEVECVDVAVTRSRFEQEIEPPRSSAGSAPTSGRPPT
jgi:hypothetical protein